MVGSLHVNEDALCTLRGPTCERPRLAHMDNIFARSAGPFPPHTPSRVDRLLFAELNNVMTHLWLLYRHQILNLQIELSVIHLPR